jgi:nucleoside 2-deoxyribosyltransferase
MKRIIYLAGPVEVEGDTWRERTAEALEKLNFETLNPLRGEEIKKVGNYVKSDISDKAIVARDKHDLERVRLSGGFVVMNLNSSEDGRNPIGTLFELQWCVDNGVPVLGIMSERNCDSRIRTHPWVNESLSYKVTSVTAAINFIESHLM